MHQRYAEFAPALIASLSKAFAGTSAGADGGRALGSAWQGLRCKPLALSAHLAIRRKQLRPHWPPFSGSSSCAGPAPTAGEDDKAGLARRRATLRLLLELLLAGLYESSSALVGAVRQLAGADFAKDPEGSNAALALLGVLAKAGRVEALGLPPALPVAVQAEPQVSPRVCVAWVGEGRGFLRVCSGLARLWSRPGRASQ